MGMRLGADEHSIMGGEIGIMCMALLTIDFGGHNSTGK